MSIWNIGFFILLSAISLVPAEYTILDVSKDLCEISLNGTKMIKKAGDIWMDEIDPCIKYVCDYDINHMKVKTVKETCKERGPCENEYELVFPKGSCCGSCMKTKCNYKNKFYAIGDHWKSIDECTYYECVYNHDKPSITSFKKSCPPIPKNCDQENIFIENCCEICVRDNVIEEKIVNDKSNDLSKLSEYEEIDTYENHTCNRECLENEPPLTCRYTFLVEWYQTLSKACYDCPFNLTDCNRPHCVLGDGVYRSILSINRMMPGPAIQVCLNDTIIVTYKNRLLDESTTIHWHGMHQRDNPYMDGVPHISQCPTSPGAEFVYKFKADAHGTQFYHSHIGMQRGDGITGSLIVRKPKSMDITSKYYDYDLHNDHTVFLQDWGHLPSSSMFSFHVHSFGNNKPKNILINGRGRYFLPDNKKNLFQLTEKSRIKRDLPIYSEESENMPFTVYKVTKDKRYRFRMINAEILNCPITVSVDNHNLTVISSDGFDIEPVEVESIQIFAGERFDFVINANQPIGNYWLRAKGLIDCGPAFSKAFQVAILRYHDAPEELPKEIPSYDYERTGLQMNTMNRGSGFNDSISIAELRASYPDDKELLKEKTDVKFYMYYDFYEVDNPKYHISSLYGYNKVSLAQGKVYSPQLNHITMKMPSLPLMPNKDILEDSMFCNETYLNQQGINCTETYCECSHVIHIPLNATVEMILIDEGKPFDASHPFHLHGNAFRVLGMERIGKSTTLDEVKALDEAGLLDRNFDHPPKKDTINVPNGGYAIIRFTASNPGYWLFHCHIEFHAEMGMSFVLKVGDAKDMVNAPENFPTCSDYREDNSQSFPYQRNPNQRTNNADKITTNFLATIILISIYLFTNFY